MTKTTDGERAGAMGERTIHGREFILRLVSDADRLAELEQELRELADEMRWASTEYCEWWRKGASQYHEGRSDQAEEDANLVYALINPPAIREAGEEDA